MLLLIEICNYNLIKLKIKRFIIYQILVLLLNRLKKKYINEVILIHKYYQQLKIILLKLIMNLFKIIKDQLLNFNKRKKINLD